MWTIQNNTMTNNNSNNCYWTKINNSKISHNYIWCFLGLKLRQGHLHHISINSFPSVRAFQPFRPVESVWGEVIFCLSFVCRFVYRFIYRSICRGGGHLKRIFFPRFTPTPPIHPPVLHNDLPTPQFCLTSAMIANEPRIDADFSGSLCYDVSASG